MLSQRSNKKIESKDILWLYCLFLQLKLNAVFGFIKGYGKHHWWSLLRQHKPAAAVTSFSFVSMLEMLVLVYVMLSLPANTVAYKNSLNPYGFPYPSFFFIWKGSLKNLTLYVIFNKKCFTSPDFSFSFREQ